MNLAASELLIGPTLSLITVATALEFVLPPSRPIEKNCGKTFIAGDRNRIASVRLRTQSKLLTRAASTERRRSNCTFPSEGI